MKRNDFKQIIKLKSYWKVDKRKGNYKLPNGSYLKDYISELVYREMEFEKLGISEDGNLYAGTSAKYDSNIKGFTDYCLFVPFKDFESVSYDEMERRISILINEIIR